jgi:hypothetical protein
MTVRLGVLLATALALAGCQAGDPSLGSGFTDRFDRADIGSDWYNSGGPYRLANGQLEFDHVHNHALWLRRRLPRDVRIACDATAHSPDGDVKVELDGDGKSFESDEAVQKDLVYTATGYVFIFGGWHNQLSTLARQNEHGWQVRNGTPSRQWPHVEPGRTYHWVIERRGNHLAWSIDGQPFLALDDPEPLDGPGHDHFGFDGWESDVSFDNLTIDPL